MTTPTFRFIDLPTSAERLGITRNELLQWIDQGRIKPFSGKGQQSVFRTADVDKLAMEVKAASQEIEKAAIVPVDEAQPATVEQRDTRTRRRDAIKLMGTRLSMDSRWAEMTDKDISTWLDAIEPVQFERIRKVAGIAIERLQRVLAMMDEFEKKRETRA